MSEKIRPGSRRIQILRILYEHGPLPIRTLLKLIQPPMTERRLQDSIKRLFKNNLVIQKFDTLPRNSGHYYQISQRLPARISIGKLLGLEPTKLLQPHFRGQELTHLETCAIWADRLRLLFPNARVVQDFRFNEDSGIQRVLMSDSADLELKPDLFIQFSEKEGSGRLSVGIEIERTRKTKKRLLNKLRKLSSKTLLDGVIYLCDKDSIRDNLEQIYSSQVRHRAIRTQHYGANFFLFGSTSLPEDTDYPKLINADGQLVNMKDWVQFLGHQSPRLRRDSQLLAAAE